MTAAGDGACERIAHWVAGLRLEDVPARVLELTRHQTMSVLAACHAGVDDEAATQVERVALARAPAGPCTALVTGEKLPLERAVPIGSARSMAIDFDDYLYMGHTGHSAVVGAWAMAEALGATSRELLLAQVAANEVGARIGASAVLGPQNGQAWSFIHATEGAVLGARLLGLDAARTAHAIAIAMYQPPFTLWPGFMGPGSKVLTASGPTLAGIQAAQLAAEGMTGALAIFEHPTRGFWSAFTFVPLPHLVSGFGRAWLTDTLAFKRYPGCAYVDTVLDATLELEARFHAEHGRPLAAADVKRVRVEASLLTIEMDRLSREHVGARLGPINVNFSVPFNVAIAILAGRHGADELRQSWLDRHESALRELAGRVELRHDASMSLAVAESFDTVLGGASIARRLGPRDFVAVVLGARKTLPRRTGAPRRRTRSKRAIAGLRFSDLGAIAAWLRRRAGRATRASDLDAVDFQRFRMCLPARVTIDLAAGGSVSARHDVPLGAPGRPGRLEAAAEKLRGEAARRMPPERAQELVQRIASFEAQPLAVLSRCACAAR